MSQFDPDSFEGRVIADLSEIKQTVKVLPDHETRIRWLERIAWGLIGVWALVGLFVGLHK